MTRCSLTPLWYSSSQTLFIATQVLFNTVPLTSICDCVLTLSVFLQLGIKSRDPVGISKELLHQVTGFKILHKRLDRLNSEVTNYQTAIKSSLVSRTLLSSKFTF